MSGLLLDPSRREALWRGIVVPAHPLALTAAREFDERRQRALTRYYLAAGAGGLAIGVHTTQFAIHDVASGLLRPVLELAAETVAKEAPERPVVKVAGLCRDTGQALGEARLAADLGYDVLLPRLGDVPGDDAAGDDAALVAHCRRLAEHLDSWLR